MIVRNKYKIKKFNTLAKSTEWKCHYCNIKLVSPSNMNRFITEERIYLDEMGKITRCVSYTLSCDYDYPTIDHKIPRTLGGTNDISNLVICCKRCNAVKSNKLTYEEALDLLKDNLTYKRNHMCSYSYNERI